MTQNKRTHTLNTMFDDIEFRIHTIEARIYNDTKLQGIYYDVKHDSFWRFEINIKSNDPVPNGRHDTKEFRTYIHTRGNHIRLNSDKYKEVRDSPEFKRITKILDRDIKIDSIITV